MIEFLLKWDQNILLWIQDFLRDSIRTEFFIFITKLGDRGTIWILTLLLLLIPQKTRKVGVMVMVALASATIVNNQILKHIVERARPYETILGLHSLIGEQFGYSFPSGHTASSFAAAFVLYLELPKKLGIPALIIAGLIGFSRLYLGVHYPTDVLCGALVGTGIAILTRKVFCLVDEKQASDIRNEKCEKDEKLC